MCFLNISCQKEVFVESQSGNESFNNGKMFIESKPAGALIYLNNKYTGYTTPDTIKWIPPGEINVKLKKTNFYDTSFTVRIGTSVTENVLIDYYGNPRMYGSIECISNPAGAVIYLNNQNSGRVTPTVIRNLIPDTYTVKFDYPEYKKDSLTLTIRSMVTSRAVVTLEDTLDIVTYFPENSGFPAIRINDFAEDKNGNIWIGTASYGLVKFDGKKFTTYRYGSSSFIPSDFVGQVEVDKENNIWVGFSNALVKYNGQTWEKTDSKQINSIYIAEDNTMLAATDQGGIIRFKNGSYDFITKANSGMASDLITAACMDRNGKIWAAYGTSGIGVYDGSSWVKLDSANNGLPFNQCSSLTLSPGGKITGMFWKLVVSMGQIVAYVPHTLAEFDGTRWVSIITKNDNTSLREIVTDNQGGLWFGMYGMIRYANGLTKPIADIVRKNLRVFSSYTNPASSILFGKQVFVDSKENIWMIGYYGLIKIKKGRWSY